MRNNNVGRRIHYLRKEAGLTMHELGEKLGFKGSTADVRISQYESGNRLPKGKLLKKIAETLHVSPDTILPPNYDTADGLMHTLFMMDDIYEFMPAVDLKNQCIVLKLNTVINNKKLQEEVNYATALWALAAYFYNYGILSYKDYQRWKHNYPNINLFELILGYPVDTDTFLNLCQKMMDAQLEAFEASKNNSNPDSSSAHDEQM